MHLLELFRRTLQHYSPVESQKMFSWTAKLYLTLHRHDVCVCVCDPLIVTAALRPSWRFRVRKRRRHRLSSVTHPVCSCWCLPASFCHIKLSGKMSVTVCCVDGVLSHAAGRLCTHWLLCSAHLKTTFPFPEKGRKLHWLYAVKIKTTPTPPTVNLSHFHPRFHRRRVSPPGRAAGFPLHLFPSVLLKPQAAADAVHAVDEANSRGLVLTCESLSSVGRLIEFWSLRRDEDSGCTALREMFPRSYSITQQWSSMATSWPAVRREEEELNQSEIVILLICKTAVPVLIINPSKQLRVRITLPKLITSNSSFSFFF